MKQLGIKDELTDFLLYTSPKGDVKVDVILNNETVWLSQKSIAQLFGVNVPAISKHLDNIYETGELNKDATVSILEIVQTEGSRNVKRNIEYFNLDAIISVGYRVNSAQATRFRIWATSKKIKTSHSTDPLHGITLKVILETLVAHYGWEEMDRQVRINCFGINPSINSSLKFLRKTPWARAKVEELYIEYCSIRP